MQEVKRCTIRYESFMAYSHKWNLKFYSKSSKLNNFKIASFNGKIATLFICNFWLCFCKYLVLLSAVAPQTRTTASGTNEKSWTHFHFSIFFERFRFIDFSTCFWQACHFWENIQAFRVFLMSERLVNFLTTVYREVRVVSQLFFFHDFYGLTTKLFDRCQKKLRQKLSRFRTVSSLSVFNSGLNFVQNFSWIKAQRRTKKKRKVPGNS